ICLQCASHSCQVLFSVTRTDRQEALARVRRALEAYLVLPSAELIGGCVDYSDEITAFKLRAAISHLHAQLELAAAHKEALKERIHAQEVVIDLLKYRTFITTSEDGPAEAPSQKNGAEQIAPYLSVTTVEHAGLRVDLPK